MHRVYACQFFLMYKLIGNIHDVLSASQTENARFSYCSLFTRFIFRIFDQMLQTSVDSPTVTVNFYGCNKYFPKSHTAIPNSNYCFVILLYPIVDDKMKIYDTRDYSQVNVATRIAGRWCEIPTPFSTEPDG